MKKFLGVIVVLMLLAGLLLSGCALEADVASQNLSRSADMFLMRRKESIDLRR